MSDLARDLAHARAMATAEHTPECTGHRPSRWGWALEVHPDPACPGCVTDADRALWAQIAGELEAHLARQTEETLL